MKNQKFIQRADINKKDVKVVVKTAIAAYNGYKAGGLPGAIIGGAMAYRESTKDSGPGITHGLML